MLKKIPVKVILQILVVAAVGILVAVLALGFAVMRVGDSLTDGLCGNNVINEIVSPDGQLKAVVFTRDCGATTAFSTQVSIIRADDKLPNNPGNVYVNNKVEDKKVTVAWLENGKLQISYDSTNKPLKMVPKITVPKFFLWGETVEIDYKGQ